MIKLTLFACLCLFSESALPQMHNISASYKVTRTMTIPAVGESASKNLILDFTGHSFVKGQKAVSFIRPLFRDLYEGGRVNTKDMADGYSYNICIDTLQNIRLVNYDSLTIKYRDDASGQGRGSHNYFTFEPNYQQWVVLPETKDIGGLICQRALLNSLTNELIWDVWFCPEIETISGAFATEFLPGLLVEGTALRTKTQYRLEKYTLDPELDEVVFNVFVPNAVFSKRGHIKKLR